MAYGAVLEQYSASGWHPISFASRYLNPAEKMYFTNDLELLAVVWATEHFRNYIYGRYFTVISDHKALLTLLNSSPKGNKTVFSRLSRWYDRLVPYDFKVEHKEGQKWECRTICLGFHPQRHPRQVNMIKVLQ